MTGPRHGSSSATRTGGGNPNGPSPFRGVAAEADRSTVVSRAGTKNFPAAMRRIGVTCSLRPDAWFTRAERRHLDVYEIEVGNPIDRNKRENYQAFVRRLAVAGWTMTIYRVNRHGTHKEFTP